MRARWWSWCQCSGLRGHCRRAGRQPAPGTIDPLPSSGRCQGDDATAPRRAGADADVHDLTRPAEVDRIHAYWRAANYLSVGQIYLLDNPLLREPLTIEHVKPRLLGHWGTTPGLNFIYAHMNRVIKRDELDAIYITGPGHGGPGMVANSYLEGSYTETYPHITQDTEGMRRLFRQFSFPGGIPSHVAPETPGSIHEGGELGYSLVHAFGAAFDNPDLVVCAWSATARPRQGRSPRAGIQTSSSIPRRTARCCRSCT